MLKKLLYYLYPHIKKAISRRNADWSIAVMSSRARSFWQRADEDEEEADVRAQTPLQCIKTRVEIRSGGGET